MHKVHNASPAQVGSAGQPLAKAPGGMLPVREDNTDLDGSVLVTCFQYKSLPPRDTETQP